MSISIPHSKRLWLHALFLYSPLQSCWLPWPTYSFPRTLTSPGFWVCPLFLLQHSAPRYPYLPLSALHLYSNNFLCERPSLNILYKWTLIALYSILLGSLVLSNTYNLTCHVYVCSLVWDPSLSIEHKLHRASTLFCFYQSHCRHWECILIGYIMILHKLHTSWN